MVLADLNKVEIGEEILNKKSFLKGAFILGVAGVVSKLLGALYRIPLARLLGGEGMGLYQMAYPIYTTILALATAGVPVAISIMVARKESGGLSGDSRRIFRVSFILLFIIGIVLSAAVFLSAGFLANTVLQQPKALLPIAAVAPAIFFAGMLSVFRGYFQGHQWMIPTAVSQVVEQIFRVAFVLILAFWLFPRGLELAAAGATFGAVIGAVAGLVVLIMFYMKFRQQPVPGGSLKYSHESARQLAGQLVKLAVPVSLGAMVVPLVQMLDAVIVPTRLISAGFSVSRATELYGELSGMASVLINLPTIFTIAIATSLVPAVAEAVAARDKLALQQRVNEGLRVAMLLALPSAVGLCVLAYQITDLLFASPEAGIPLAYLSFSVIVLAIFQVTSASLQGIGHPEIPLRHLMVTGLLKIFFNFYLTGLVYLNIKGPAIGTTLAFLVGCALNMIQLARRTGVDFEWGRYLKLALITVVMGIMVYISYETLVIRGLHSHLTTLVAIAIGVGVYGIALLVTRELDLALIRRLLRFGRGG